MSERSDAFRDQADYAAVVAGVGEQASRDRGVSVDRVKRMQWALEALRSGDPDAFYVCVNRYATEAAQAVARCLSARADMEADNAIEFEPTNPRGFTVPPEARRDHDRGE